MSSKDGYPARLDRDCLLKADVNSRSKLARNTKKTETGKNNVNQSFDGIRK